MFKDLRNRIIFILSYTDQFQYPLSKEEIFLRLIGIDGLLSLNQFENQLMQLVSSGKISLNNGFFSLKKSQGNVEIRKERNRFSNQKWLEVDYFVKFIKHIPWIKAIVVTGSLAVNNAKKNDDIDFMIITKRRRLWLTRILVLLFVIINGKRRSWNKEEANSWCLNLWLDEDSLKLPKRLENIYGAYEICQSVWVFDRNNTKQTFLKLNNWSKYYLPHYYNYQIATVPKFVSIQQSMPFGMDSIISNLNSFLYFIQYQYMRPHMTRERVAKNYAFFHPRETKKQIFRKWLGKFKENAI